MGEPRPQPSPTRSAAPRVSSQLGTPPLSPPLPPKPPVSLIPPSPKRKHKNGRTLRAFRSMFRSFPIITPTACKLPSLPGGVLPDPYRGARTGTKVTGTLFGYRKGRVSLSLQENPRCLPTLVLEMAMQMNVLQKELSTGLVRIALECEKSAAKEKGSFKLLEEPIWSMYYNGKKTGYAIKREANEEDLYVMELLRAVSMGAGVLPAQGKTEVEQADGELTYMRAFFDHVVGSKDSESLYMLSPEGNHGPDLTIFMVRL